MKRSTQQRRLKWNLIQISSAHAAKLAFTRVGGQLLQQCTVAHPSGSNLQLATKTDFSRVSSLSLGVHVVLMYLIISFIN